MRVPMVVVDGVRYRPEHAPDAVLVVPGGTAAADTPAEPVVDSPELITGRRSRPVQTKQAGPGVDRPA